VRVINRTRGTLLADRASAARSFWSRLAGLLGRASLKPGEALLIEPCSSVHTLFMRFAIDVLYVDRGGVVVKCVPDLRPFRASAAIRGARSVIELPGGTIRRTATTAGDQLSFEA
jgi:hypothetical protein